MEETPCVACHMHPDLCRCDYYDEPQYNHEWDIAQEGDHIRLIEMPNDPCPVEPGTTGIITDIHASMAQIQVMWQAARSLNLAPSDRFKIIQHGIVIEEE